MDFNFFLKFRQTIYLFLFTKTPINLVLHLKSRTKPGNFFSCTYFARDFSKLFVSNFTKVWDAVFKISRRIRNKISVRRVANGTESNGKNLFSWITEITKQSLEHSLLPNEVFIFSIKLISSSVLIILSVNSIKIHKENFIASIFTLKTPQLFLVVQFFVMSGKNKNA